VLRVALRIDDPDLLDRVSAMLADEPHRVTLDPAEFDVVITDHLPVREDVPTLFLGESSNALEIVENGASGVLPHNVAAPDLMLAMDAVGRGFTIFPRDVSGSEAPGSMPLGPTDHPHPVQQDPTLTARELEVLRLLAEGASNKLIARRLGISFHTAKFHVASIAAKLDATGRTDAVAQAVRLGLILL
jgi:DNA-binding NarL/FixJ family response regulator